MTVSHTRYELAFPSTIRYLHRVPIEKSHGRARPTLPRASDLPLTELEEKLSIPRGDHGHVLPGAKLAVKRWEKGLIYEFAIPLKELYPLQVTPGATVRFNFIVNDDDGGGRAKWIGITPGIGERKAPYLFKRLYFAE